MTSCRTDTMCGQQKCNENRLKTATKINDLGVLAYREGDLHSAHNHFEKAYILRRGGLGDHPDTAQTLNNIAAIHFQNRKYAQCVMYVHRALAIATNCLGVAHPITLDYRRGLEDAKIYLKQRRKNI